MREYHEEFRHELPHLPQEPVLQVYVPQNSMVPQNIQRY